MGFEVGGTPERPVVTARQSLLVHWGWWILVTFVALLVALVTGHLPRWILATTCASWVVGYLVVTFLGPRLRVTVTADEVHFQAWVGRWFPRPQQFVVPLALVRLQWGPKHRKAIERDLVVHGESGKSWLIAHLQVGLATDDPLSELVWERRPRAMQRHGQGREEVPRELRDVE